jgi:hypothetical protein
MPLLSSTATSKGAEQARAVGELGCSSAGRQVHVPAFRASSCHASLPSTIPRPANTNQMAASTGNSAGAPNPYVTGFERVLTRFKSDLKKRDRDNFQMATLEGLQQAVGDIQKKQQTERRMQNMMRLKKFIEAMEQYGKVLDVFCNSSQFVPFIWVSTLLLLFWSNAQPGT